MRAHVALSFENMVQALGRPEITMPACNDECPPSRVTRTLRLQCEMSANDHYRTCNLAYHISAFRVKRTWSLETSCRYKYRMKRPPTKAAYRRRMELMAQRPARNRDRTGTGHSKTRSQCRVQ